MTEGARAEAVPAARGILPLGGSLGRMLILIAAGLILFGLCCLPTKAAKLVIVPALLVGAVTSWRVAPVAWSAALRRAPDLMFLGFALVWITVSSLASGSSVSTVGALASNVVLLALLGVTVRGVAASGLERPFLALFVGAAALGALLSATVHLHGVHGFERLGSVALNGLIIPAAGGYACALVAALALWRTTPSRAAKTGLAVAAAILLVALAWSGSRGPIVAFAAALLSIPLVEPATNRFALVFACLAAFALTASAILFEPQIHALLCSSDAELMCRQSLRLELWGWAATSIARHPVLGVGFGHYFSEPNRPHPHNGLLALAFFAGVPLLLGFLALAFAAAVRLHRAARSPLALYAAPALVIGWGYMGTDLANALGFIGTHYQFIWLPIFTAFALSDIPQ